MNKTNCTESTLGIVKGLKDKGLNFPTLITVEYQVGEDVYEVTESIKLKSEKIKLGFLTIGQKKVAVMGNTTVGSSTSVSYNPHNPSEAYITNNIGKVNV